MDRPEPKAEASSHLTSDADRISAELLGSDAGTDPFVAAVRATRMPMIITNPRLPDNPVVFANQAFSRLTGYSNDEILGRNCRFLQGPDSDQEARGKISAAVKAEKSIEIDIRNYRKNGEPFWNRLLLAPVNDLEGKLAYFFASQVDVTLEREKLQSLENSNAALIAELADRLREQQHREEDLRFTLDAGRFGSWSLNVVNQDLTTSPVFREIFGRDASDPFTWSDLQLCVHPDDRSRMQEAISSSVESGKDYEIEFRIVTKDRLIRWVAIRGRPSPGTEGKVLRLAGVALDITEETRARLMRQGLIDLTEVVRDLGASDDISFKAGRILGQTLGVDRAGYGSVDPVAGTITIERDWCAPGVPSLAGTLTFRDYGTFIDDLMVGQMVSITDCETDPRTASTASAMRSVQALAIINEPVIEDGKLVALFFVNSGTPRQWQKDEKVFLREVSSRTRTAVERRRAEMALRELNENLEAKVGERTKQLSEAESALRQAQKMEAVGQLTGGLAHDFNNLLSAIGGSLELIEKRIKKGNYDDLPRFTSTAQAAVDRAASLTHRLLAFSRRQTLDPKPTNVNRLVSDIEELITRTITPAVQLKIVVAEDLWMTLVDPHQLENALLNLCINARDAMPHGGHLVIETRNAHFTEIVAPTQGLQPGQFIKLSVSDTGSGMTPEVIAKAFDPFFTTKPIGSGTGLGLSMVYGFAQQSGGQVRIHSQIDIGTTVSIYLPKHHIESVDVSHRAEPMEEVPQGEGETVLIVDDEAPIRMLLAESLVEAGFKVIQAEDGPKGLQILQSGIAIDLLVTDVGLPGLNGRQVADAARVGRPDLKVIFITGFAESSLLTTFNLAPGMTVLTKPFQIDALLRKVGEILKSDSDATSK